jgi:hypothetical protein
MEKLITKLRIHGVQDGVCKDIYILLEMGMEKENVGYCYNHQSQFHDLLKKFKIIYIKYHKKYI